MAVLPLALLLWANPLPAQGGPCLPVLPGNCAYRNNTNFVFCCPHGHTDFIIMPCVSFLSGQVKDGHGDPVNNAIVFASGGDGCFDFQAMTDTNGDFCLGLLAGSYQLRVDDSKCGWPAPGLVCPSVPVTIAGGVCLTNFILVCPTITGAIQVQVNGPSGRGLPGIGAWASLTNGITNYITDGHEALTARSGAVTLPVFNGVWQVSLDSNEVRRLGFIPPSSQNTTINHSTNLVTFDLVSSRTSFTITVLPLPPNGGTVSGGGRFDQGSSDTVTAVASKGYLFKNWTSNGVAVSSSSSYSFLLRANLTLLANFTLTNPPVTTNYSYTVTASPVGGGTVSAGGSNTMGHSITVAATNNSGYSFVHWTSNGVVTATTTNYTFILNTNVALVANFVFTNVPVTTNYSYTVAASPAGSGTVSPGGSNTMGHSITVMATNNSGYSFVHWTSNGVVTATTTNYTFVLNTNVTLVASFIFTNVPVTTNYTYTVTASPAGSGTVSPGGSNTMGHSITVVATNNSGYSFAHWTSNGVVTATTTNYTFVLNTNVTLVADFVSSAPTITANYSYTVSASPASGGTVSPSGSNSMGQSITVIATNNAGYSFVHWTSNGTVTAATTNYTFALNTNVTLVASFVLTHPVIAVFNAGAALSNGQSSAINLGTAAFQEAGPIMTFTVSNLGFQPLTLTNITVSSNFTLLSSSPATITDYPWTIPGLSNTASASSTFSVQLGTATPGQVAGLVTISNNDSNSNPFVFPVTGFVTVKGVGLTGNLDSSGLSGGLYFGVVKTNATSMLTLTISNLGNIALNVAEITSSLPVFTVSSPNPTIAPGGFQAITITFAPTKPTNYSGTITVFSDATNGVQSIPVSGFGANTNTLLTVLVNGPGRVTPVLTKIPLKLGHRYTLTAVASNGCIFSNWSGSLNTYSNPLSFYMSNGTIFEATFVTNPFFAYYKGTYNGLFMQTNGVTEQTAGMLKGLAVNTRGNYTGVLLIQGVGHALSGKFNVFGQATNLIHRPGAQGGPLDVELNLLTVSNAPAELTGTIIGTNGETPWMSQLIADHAAATTNSARYTLTIAPDTNNPASNSVPIGEGYALLSDHRGMVTVTGALADGTTFSQVVPASGEQEVPVYAHLYGGKGLVMGWVNLGTNYTGPLYWVYPGKHGTMFTDAFTNISPVNLSPWSNNPPANKLPTSLQLVEMTEGAAPLTNIYSLTISNDYQLGATSGSNELSGSINPKTGQLTLIIGSGESMIKGHGAVLLNATNGGGYFSTNTVSGAIFLNP